ncbi:unnamed protein product [Leuciscus chuanchicus]
MPVALRVDTKAGFCLGLTSASNSIPGDIQRGLVKKQCRSPVFSSVIPLFHTALLPHQASASIFAQQKTRHPTPRLHPALLNNSPVPLESLSAVWVSGPYQMLWERGVLKTQ